MPQPASIEVVNRGGLYLPEADLWLDPHRVHDFGFVSHAHADHYANHRQILCSEPTAGLIKARFRPRGEIRALAWDDPTEIGPFTARLLPAGHIHGSAQLHLTRRSDGASLLYSGDFKMRRGLASEAIQSRPADTLIMETTFGLPRYELPPTETVIGDMVAFVRKTLDDGEVPLMLAYSLGKAQEIHLALARAAPELKFMLYKTVAEMSAVCAGLGVAQPEYKKFDPENAAGHVVILPPNVLRNAPARSIAKKRSAMISGWGADPSAKYRYRADAVFPLPDHADYPDLIRYVEEIKPKRVLTLHGYDRQFAADLRRRGWNAWALRGGDQLELSI